MPLWIQVLQALLTPAIALAVCVIGFLQWRTAHQKVMLDLFERRLKVYESVADAVLAYVNRKDGVDSSRALSLLRSSYLESRFLFGDAVPNRIEHLQREILDHRRLERRSDSSNVTDEERSEMIDQVSDLEDKLAGMLLPWTDLLEPYLKMDQRRVLTPIEWFKERNRQRLSYADEKQK